jgi:hypothetical protein
MLGDCQETLQAIVRVGNIHNNPPWYVRPTKQLKDTRYIRNTC